MAERRNRRDFTRAEALALVSYDSMTGHFYWAGPKGKPGVRIGARAGAVVSYGYRAIRLDGFLYSEHRLAFLIMTGEIPEEVDHQNGDRADNRWQNLRKATRWQNTWNSSKGSRNTSGMRGVSWDPANKNWRVRIMVQGKRISIGSFASKDDAIDARRDAERIHYGEFAKSASQGETA